MEPEDNLDFSIGSNEVFLIKLSTESEAKEKTTEEKWAGVTKNDPIRIAEDFNAEQAGGGVHQVPDVDDDSEEYEECSDPFYNIEYTFNGDVLRIFGQDPEGLNKIFEGCINALYELTQRSKKSEANDPKVHSYTFRAVADYPGGGDSLPGRAGG